MQKTSANSGNKGQALVFVILLMSIALAVGTSISSRTISSIRRTTNIDSAQRARAAATAGVEFYLSKSGSALETAITSNGGSASGCPSTTNSIVYPSQSSEPLSEKTDNVDTSVQVRIGRYGCLNNPSDPPFTVAIAKDNLLELKLGGGGGSNSVDICFTSASPASSLYLTLISGTSPNYSIKKYGYNQAGVSSSNNFQSTTSNGTDSCINSSNFDLGSNPQILRILSLYNSSTVKIKTLGNYNLPFQGYTISATATVGGPNGTVKTVNATKSLPYLPVPFNFGVYSQSASDAL